MPDNDATRAAQGQPLWKPRRGEKLLEHKDKRAKRVAAEQKAMRAAKTRDGNKCRVPRCEFAPKKLPIDPAHMIHRGMGGRKFTHVGTESRIGVSSTRDGR